MVVLSIIGMIQILFLLTCVITISNSNSNSNFVFVSYSYFYSTQGMHDCENEQFSTSKERKRKRKDHGHTEQQLGRIDHPSVWINLEYVRFRVLPKGNVDKHTHQERDGCGCQQGQRRHDLPFLDGPERRFERRKDQMDRVLRDKGEHKGSEIAQDREFYLEPVFVKASGGFSPHVRTRKVDVDDDPDDRDHRSNANQGSKGQGCHVSEQTQR
mmetsp:Transcript_4766/g.10474  ORF Transcript_4766/g.10474 Transcript_4766/m.10474 type:complete len:213 (+) Transcript_4766:171-809(+)